MIQIRIHNHEEAARTQAPVLSRFGAFFDKLGLLDLRQKVEDEIAKQIAEQLKQKGVQAEVMVVDDAPKLPAASP